MKKKLVTGPRTYNDALIQNQWSSPTAEVFTDLLTVWLLKLTSSVQYKTLRIMLISIVDAHYQNVQKISIVLFKLGVELLKNLNPEAENIFNDILIQHWGNHAM